MRFFSARFRSLAALVPAVFLLVLVPACGKQSEGERCGEEPPSSNDDCADGLVCTLVNSGDVNRCCYPDYANGHVTDSNCEKRTTTQTGSGGAGGAGGGDAAGGSTAGTSGGGS